MSNYNFKVGDKVRQKDPKRFSMGDKILTVIDWDLGDNFVAVWYEGVYGHYFPLKPCEIEHVVRVGEQLLFSFMYQVVRPPERGLKWVSY